MLIDASYFVGELNIPNTDSPAVKERLDWFINKYEVQILRDVLGVDLYRAFMSALGQTVISQAQSQQINSINSRDDLILTVGQTAGFNPGQNIYNDSSFVGWSYSIEQRGIGTLRPGIEIQFLSTGGFQFINGYIIQSNEIFIIHFKNQIVTASIPISSNYLNVMNGIANSDTMDERWVWLLNGLEYIGLDARMHKWQGFIAVADDTSPKKSLLANGVYCYWMRGDATKSAGIGEVVAKAENAVNVSNTSKVSAIWNEMVDWLHEMIWFLDTFTSGQNQLYNPQWWLQNRYYLLKTYKKINPFNI